MFERVGAPRYLTTPITAQQRNEIKKLILRCLTEDVEYGRTKTGKPLKKRRKNHAIFDKQRGYAIYTSTSLDMVMDAVVLGLSFAMDKEAPNAE